MSETNDWQLLPADVPADQQVTELHAWIATHANGGEGIVASALPGLGTVPLVSSKREMAERLTPIAARVAEKSKGRGPDEVVALQLVTFRKAGRQ